MTGATGAAGTAANGKPVRWGRVALLAASAVLYAFAVLSGIAHLISLAAQGSLTPVGWGVLLFGVLLPVIVFLLALVIVRRRGWKELTLVMLAGLGVVAAFRLSLVAYSILNVAALVSV